MSRQIGIKNYHKYSDDTLQHAVHMIQSKAMSLRKAASVFNIPKSTLSNKINGKTVIGCRSGPGTVLTKAEEDMLASWAVRMAQMGFGRTKAELRDAVKCILDKDNRQNPFTNNRPGKDWYYAFLKRHPELSSRTPQQLSKERAVITPSRVEHWFRDFMDFMADETNDTLLWKDPTRWFNADESGFPLCPKSGKVLAPKGVPNIYNFTSSDKTQVTVLACMNAAGLYVRPLIVFPGQRFSYNPLADFPDAVLGRTDTGWMDSELFLTWLRDVFSPALDECSIKRPVVLFVDGHSTHATLEASKFCMENNIILYCLLEHASHLMQPCDLKLFSVLKECWKQSVRDYQIANIGDYVTKAKFAAVFKSAWQKACTVEISVKGFRDSGLFPLDPTKVLGTLKMEPSKLFTNNNTQTQTSSCVVSTPGPSSVCTPTLTEAETVITSTDVTTSSQVDGSDPIENVSTQNHTTEPTTNSSSTLSNTLVVNNDVHPSPVERSDVSAQGDATSTCTLTTVDVNVSSKAASLDSQSRDQYVSPALQDVLKIPVVSKSTKSSSKRLKLPKAISGKKFHDLLAERQRQKEEEIANKENRRKEREMRKVEKQQEKEKKEKQRKEKQILKEKLMKEKENKKRVKEIEKLEKLKRKRESDSDTDVSVEFEPDDDEMADVDRSIKDSCYACEAPCDNNFDNWIQCTKCGRWLHRACVTTIDLLALNEGEIVDLQFECDYC